MGILLLSGSGEPIELAGVAAAIAATPGSSILLTKDLISPCNALSAVTSILDITKDILSNVAALSNTAAILDGGTIPYVALDGVVAASSTASGTITGLQDLFTLVPITSSLTGLLTKNAELAVMASASATGSADISLVKFLDGLSAPAINVVASLSTSQVVITGQLHLQNLIVTSSKLKTVILRT